MSNAKRRTLSSIENVGLDDDESDNDTIICYYESDVSDESVVFIRRVAVYSINPC